MSTTTRPLVVFSDLSICDGPGGHDVEVWTDGTTAYAHIVLGEHGTTSISRDLTQIEVPCPHRDYRTEEPCTGYARFDLSDEAWTTDARAIEMLTAYGEKIER